MRKQGWHYCSVNYFRLHSIRYHRSPFRSRWFQSENNWYITHIGMLGLTFSIQLFWIGLVWLNLILVKVSQRDAWVFETNSCFRNEDYEQITIFGSNTFFFSRKVLPCCIEYMLTNIGSNMVLLALSNSHSLSNIWSKKKKKLSSHFRK